MLKAVALVWLNGIEVLSTVNGDIVTLKFMNINLTPSVQFG